MSSLHKELDRRLLGEIHSSPRIQETMFALCDGIGPRFAGGKGEAAAAEYILQEFRDMGLSGAGLERFQIQGWKRGGESFVRIPRFPERGFGVIELPFSPATGPEGVSGPLKVLWEGTPEEFGAAGKTIAGAVLLTREGVSSHYPRSIHRAEKYGRAVAAGAAGFLFANAEPGGLAPTGCARFGRKGEIPAAGLSLENAELLKRLASRQELVVSLRTSGAFETAVSANVIAEIPGKDRNSETVVVGGHLDSHDISPGAHDNASGICVILAVAEALAAACVEPYRRIRFIAFGAEEFGLKGSRHHAANLGEGASGISLMINVDAPPLSGPLGFQIYKCSDAAAFFNKAGSDIKRKISLMDGLHQHSDQFPFLMAGAPAAVLASPGSGYKGGRGWGHTAADTPDKVDVEALKSAAALLAPVIVRLAAPDGLRLPSRSRGEVERILSEASIEEALKYET